MTFKTKAQTAFEAHLSDAVTTGDFGAAAWAFLRLGYHLELHDADGAEAVGEVRVFEVAA